jgi:hypothetical protein
LFDRHHTDRHILSSLIDDGWTQCYSDTYANNAGALSSIRSACDAYPLILQACGLTSSTTLTLAAYTTKQNFWTLSELDSVVDNQVAFYYSDRYSWGFAPAGASMKRDSSYNLYCDTETNTASDKRLCWLSLCFCNTN